MEILLACVAIVSVRFRSKERGTRVKDRAENGASKRAGSGILGFGRARDETRAIFRAIFDSCSHSLLLNCTKRLLRRLGLDLGAKPLPIRLYGVGCPVPLGGCFLLGVSRISCRSFHCLCSFPLSLSLRHQSPCWHSL